MSVLLATATTATIACTDRVVILNMSIFVNPYLLKQKTPASRPGFEFLLNNIRPSEMFFHRCHDCLKNCCIHGCKTEDFNLNKQGTRNLVEKIRMDDEASRCNISHRSSIRGLRFLQLYLPKKAKIFLGGGNAE
jgi:hypothetical protein